MAFAGLVLATAVCSDLTSPTGVNAVSIRFRNAPLPRPDTVFVTVGDRVAPPVVVMLGQTEQPRARYVFSTTNQFVARPFAGGDSVEVVSRGSSSLIATLVGTTIGNNVIGGAASQTADTVVLIAAAASNSVTPPTVSFGTLGRTRQLTATSIGSGGQPITGANIVWRSVNPAIVSVDAGTGLITSAGNGTADVYAVFEGVDSTFSRVTVQQTLDKYDLNTPAAANLRSINEMMTVTATAKDSLGNTLVAGAAVAPPAIFQSDDPGAVEVDPVSGVITARANTTAPVRITATVGGVLRSDTLLTTVRQVAASIAIQSPDTLRIPSIGGQILNLSVLAPDALGTQVPGSSIIWTSTNPSKVVVDGTATATITAQDTGTVKVAARADQQTDTVVVIVTNDAAAVVLSPKPFALRSLDEIGTLTATVTNASGSPMPGTPLTWISRDSSIVEPQPQPGFMRARAVGETRVVVRTPNGLADSVTVRVTNAPDTVRIVPDSIVLPSIGSVNSTYAVDFRNGLGVSLPKSSVAWSSANPLVASVAIGTGDITAQGSGLTYILAVSPENPVRRDSVYVRVIAGAIAQLAIVQAPSATAQSGVPLPVQPTVQLLDANGNPANQTNVSVTATVTGGGVLTGVTTVLSDATGLATFTDLAIFGTAGPRTLRFTTSGATPITAPVTLIAGIASQILPISNTSQSATVGTAVGSIPGVQVRDASNNPVVGHPVVFAITSGGGTMSPVSGSTVNTDASGNAVLTSWTLGTTAGASSVSATAVGLAGSPVSFIATGTPDVVTAGLSSVARTGPDNVLADGTASSMITVTLRDQHGNPVPGRTVSLDDAGSTSAITPVSATSNAAGQFTFSVSNTTGETVTYTATANDPGAIVITQTAQVTFGNPAPTLTSLSLTSGNRTETLSVVFSGTGFVAGASSVNVGAGIAVNAVTVNSATQITANFTISGTAVTGARDFSVTNAAPGGGTSLPQSFTITNPIPAVTSVNPPAAVQGENARQVVITGTGFGAGSTVSFGPTTNLTVNSTTVDSPTQITVSVSIGAGAALGSRSVTVTNPAPGGGTSAPLAFTITTPPAPTLTSISRSTGDRLETMNVVFTGTGFASGVSTVVVGPDITVNAMNVDSPTQITAHITIAAAATLGARNFSVNNTPTGGTSGAQTFTVNNPAPTIATVTPNPVAGAALGVTVPTTIITGSGFIDGVTIVDFVQGDVAINGTVTFNSSAQITVTNIQYPIAGLGVSRTLRITNPGRTPVTQTITLTP